MQKHKKSISLRISLHTSTSLTLISSAFRGTGSLIKCSQEPATNSYPEPNESSRHSPIVFYIILHLNLGLYNFPSSISNLFHAYHMPCPSHPSWSDHTNNKSISERIHIMKFFILQFSPASP
jgi:hypothetical protein